MSEERPIELEPPDGVEEAEEAVEILRAFIGDGALLVSLNSTAFGDKIDNWGRLLAEIGHHIARAAALNGFMTEAEAKAALRDAFVGSIEAPAMASSGRLKGHTEH